jgi:hypothetical protein
MGLSESPSTFYLFIHSFIYIIFLYFHCLHNTFLKNIYIYIVLDPRVSVHLALNLQPCLGAFSKLCLPRKYFKLIF